MPKKNNLLQMRRIQKGLFVIFHRDGYVINGRKPWSNKMDIHIWFSGNTSSPAFSSNWSLGYSTDDDAFAFATIDAWTETMDFLFCFQTNIFCMSLSSSLLPSPSPVSLVTTFTTICICSFGKRNEASPCSRGPLQPSPRLFCFVNILRLFSSRVLKWVPWKWVDEWMS